MESGATEAAMLTLCSPYLLAKHPSFPLVTHKPAMKGLVIGIQSMSLFNLHVRVGVWMGLLLSCCFYGTHLSH